MKIAKPEVEGVQEKVKRARTQEEKMAANQEMMEVYKKYDINPMKSALGCFICFNSNAYRYGIIFRIALSYWWRYYRTSTFLMV